MSYLIYLLAFIFILGSAVVLHEFGHFIVAKLFKIRVETFSVGFGPRLFGKKWGHTDYRVSAIPLGGYVKLGGDESNAPLEGASAEDIPPEEMFNLRPRWQRISVALAGPIMNILTALAIPFAGAFIYGVPATPQPVVYYLEPRGAAEQAGLKPGDRIVSFNGADDPTWDVITGDALLSPGRPMPIVVNRNGSEVSLTITPTTRTENGDSAGTLDFVPDYGGLPVIVGVVTPDSPAAAAGLKEDDRFISIDGQDVRSAAQVTEYVRAHNKQKITMTVQRDGQNVQLVSDERRIEGNKLGFVVSERYPLHAATIGSASKYAWDQNIQILRLTGKALGQVFSGQRSVRNTLSGPIGIYQATQKSIEKLGWDGAFGMLGFLSLNLGIFNLLPIPVLDGGAIFLLLIEGLLALVGLSISTAVRERIQQVGFVVVLLLMVFVISNDFLKVVSRNHDEEKPPATETAK
ncbi:MAG TPA: RIP metalloprotease RseP [Pyrinomonadaceae bacterium]|nr:RIP metalloprotease RseP [Pyrinomonadaceae bacterium]